ncbi:hypothetical protein C5167_046689 [Papaver somniferum]|uniref:lipoyl(octanoyl) transferase n=1 Tax=Papaver somniferum TaxID=3469 RepID=A0A4Y7LI18_PAPSO|nr:hypothetical protein C5167_046689 [Papaver somniferum]
MRLLRRSLEVLKMGSVNYLDALKLQEKIVSDRKLGKISDTLLSLQHPPTYTLGKRRTDHNLLVSKDELQNIGFGARKYVENLQLTMIELASLYGVKARVGSKCETGVWVGEKKIGAIGVRISSGVTSHGLAFNIDPDLNYFKHIVPCGIPNKGVTSLRREIKLELPSEEVLHEQLVSSFAKSFGFTNLVWKENVFDIVGNSRN